MFPYPPSSYIVFSIAPLNYSPVQFDSFDFSLIQKSRIQGKVITGYLKSLYLPVSLPYNSVKGSTFNNAKFTDHNQAWNLQILLDTNLFKTSTPGE